VDDLRAALERGILTQMIVNRIEQQDNRSVTLLRILADQYQHFELWNFGGQSEGGPDLHAKAVCADSRLAVVGSSNLSFRGLVANFELGVVVHGDAARTLSDRMRLLLSSRLVQRFR